MGYIYRNYRECIDGYLENKAFSWILFSVFLCLNFVLMILNLDLGFSGLEMFGSKYDQPILVYLSAIFGSFAVIVIARMLPSPILRYIGKDSIIYFMWHQTIVLPSVNRLLMISGFFLSYNDGYLKKLAYHTVQVSITVVVLTVCNMIVSNTKLKKVFCL